MPKMRQPRTGACPATAAEHQQSSIISCSQAIARPDTRAPLGCAKVRRPEFGPTPVRIPPQRGERVIATGKLVACGGFHRR